LGTAKRYTIDHEWISFDDSTQMGTIGITEYAQKALGDVVYVELPKIDTAINAGGESKCSSLCNKVLPSFDRGIPILTELTVN
jgi:glycine cleavage system H lipoate-binding protein